jgi:hypothetical protein
MKIGPIERLRTKAGNAYWRAWLNEETSGNDRELTERHTGRKLSNVLPWYIYMEMYFTTSLSTNLQAKQLMSRPTDCLIRWAHLESCFGRLRDRNLETQPLRENYGKVVAAETDSTAVGKRSQEKETSKAFEHTITCCSRCVVCVHLGGQGSDLRVR